MNPSSARHRRLEDLVTLIHDLTGEVIRSQSIAELFAASFRKLHACVPFDVAVAVMIEQNLDLYISTRAGAHSLVSEELIARIRRALETRLPVSFATAEVVVRSELHDLPSCESHQDGGHHTDNETDAILEQGRRPAGLLLLYRREPAMQEDERQILEIFAAQVSMLLDNLHANARIVALADTDDLTGVWNKRFFRRQLPQEIERARTYNVPLSLMFFDIDEFKQINDHHGHTMGDVVLSELCGAVRETLRPPDFLARFGGDEFAVILPHTDIAGARAVADRILRAMHALVIPTEDDGGMRCSVSIGLAQYDPVNDVLAQDLVRRADERLYDAKRAGKNRHSS